MSAKITNRDHIANHLEGMASNTIRNYIIPGVNSSLLERGSSKVRMFQSTRDYAGVVTPHNHRFDFICYVVEGTVENTMFVEAPAHKNSDVFTVRTLEHTGMGAFEQYAPDDIVAFKQIVNVHTTGDWYGMEADEFHSIRFGKNTTVLFFEGPQLREWNQVLLPRENGHTLETMNCDQEWMYR